MRSRNLGIICVAILAWGFFFWPTLWRYDRMGVGASALPMRVNRVTGAVDLMIPNLGWDRQESPQQISKPAEVLPAAEQAKLQGTGKFRYNTSFEVSLYNGSAWDISEIEYQISARPPGGVAKTDTSGAGYWSARTFKSTVSIASLTTGADFFTVGFVAGDADAEWHIVSARGTRAKR